MSRVISEEEFRDALKTALATSGAISLCESVTGPGRSGAIASVYASHALGIPFLPYGQKGPGPTLLIDTARASGATLRKAVRRYESMGVTVWPLAVFNEPPRVKFWYERGAS